MPDVSPMTNALGWSLAIIFGCWAVMQLAEVVAALRQPGSQAPPVDEPALEEPPPATAGARH